MCVGRHLGFSISGFLPVQTYGINTCPIDHENIGVAVEIALLSSVETEIIVLPLPV